MPTGRSRARFEGPPSAGAAPLSQAADDADYAAFYKGRHAFECVSWSCDGEINDFFSFPPAGYDKDAKMPDAMLDDRAFARGFFKAPFEFIMDPCDLIRVEGLSPDISLRELSARLQAAVAKRQADDGVWTKNGELNTADEEALAWANCWLEEGPGSAVGWGGGIEDLSFGYAYWLARPYIDGHTIKAGNATGGGCIFIDSWGS